MSNELSGASRPRRFEAAARPAWSLAVAACLAVGAAFLPPHAAAAPSATERGLDLFVHVPTSAAGGDVLPISVQALGFPTATTVAPVAGAAIEVTWDPESLLDPTKKYTAPPLAPLTVQATADADGRATLLLPVPKGRTKAITLLVSVKTADRERVREVVIQRTPSERLDLFVSDPRVVPGSEVVAWSLWASPDRSKPVTGAPIEYVLTQGGMVRFKKTATTDGAGATMMRVPIPRDDEPGAEWVLTARPVGRPEGLDDLARTVNLAAREETPGKPTLWSTFDEGRVVAGGKARYRIRVRDASGEGVAGHEIWVWTGPTGTAAPKDEEPFRKVAARLVTDGAGEVVADVAAPSTIPLRGTEVHLEARTLIEGLPRTTKSTIEVGQRRGYAFLTPEAGEIVPGLEQKLVLGLWGDDDKPIVGTFTAKGDGLDATFTTNDQGEAEIPWKAPKGIGAARSTGPCPGQVAAQVTLRAKEASVGAKLTFGGALTDPGGMPLCVPVRRDATALVRPSKLVVREGEALSFAILGGDKRPASVFLTQASGAQSAALWTADAGKAQTIGVPAGASGTLTLHAALPRPHGKTEIASAAVLVLPSRLPKVTASVTGGRAAPGGKVTVTAELADENGKPMVGSIAAVVIDKLGGGSFGPLSSIDTRSELCEDVGASEERCELALLGGPEMDPLRRGHLRPAAPLGPISDPAANAKQDMNDTFAAVVKSLEGAVFEAAQAKETLPDVRRKENGKYVFNPELMTLVTDAMTEQPTTPGGEPVSLGDLMAVDGQITFDNVAKRVTRLKLFTVLDQVRLSRAGFDPDEPLFADPNVFLRKLVREGTVGEPALLDPWGGQISFHKSDGEYVPFISFKRGWELRSPGPDGKMGSGDDVKSPFERVLKAGTPYALAMGEQNILDARYEMLVADVTVEAWRRTFEEHTGTALGDSFGAGGLALGGTGMGGGGSGHGMGMGGIGGRGTSSVPKGVAHVVAPIRTDAAGRVTFEIPLGDLETTWRVAVVGLPDGGRPAMNAIDVPVTIPLSAKVLAGASWTDEDSGEIVVQVRNRSDADAAVALEMSATGTLVLDPAHAKKTVQVGKRGAALVRVPVRAKGWGGGALEVRTRAPGLPEDTLTHTLEVRPKGELLRIARAAWVTKEQDLGPRARSQAVHPHWRGRARPRPGRQGRARGRPRVAGARADGQPRGARQHRGDRRGSAGPLRLSGGGRLEARRAGEGGRPRRVWQALLARRSAARDGVLMARPHGSHGVRRERRLDRQAARLPERAERHVQQRPRVRPRRGAPAHRRSRARLLDDLRRERHQRARRRQQRRRARARRAGRGAPPASLRRAGHAEREAREARGSRRRGQHLGRRGRQACRSRAGLRGAAGGVGSDQGSRATDAVGQMAAGAARREGLLRQRGRDAWSRASDHPRGEPSPRRREPDEGAGRLRRRGRAGGLDRVERAEAAHHPAQGDEGGRPTCRRIGRVGAPRAHLPAPVFGRAADRRQPAQPRPRVAARPRVQRGAAEAGAVRHGPEARARGEPEVEDVARRGAPRRDRRRAHPAPSGRHARGHGRRGAPAPRGAVRAGRRRQRAHPHDPAPLHPRRRVHRA